MSLAFFLVAIFWCAGIVAASRARRDPRQRLDPPRISTEPHPLPAVDVVVPARDEERNLPPLLDSLLAQDHPPARIVVVDDASTDGTRAVVESYAAKDARIVLLRGEGPPAGWKGKPAALVKGLLATSAPWILFVDADVRLAPANLRAALSEVRQREWQGISLWGRWILPPGPVRWLQCVIGSFVRGAHPLDRVNDPGKKDAFLNGQYLLISREALAAIGGWEAVKDDVLEDVALAKLAKAKKVPVGLLRAPELLGVEPYRTLEEVWAGYAKNFVAGAGGIAPSLGVAALIFLASILPFVVAFFGTVVALVSVFTSGTSADPATTVLSVAASNPATLTAWLASVAAVLFRASTAEEHSHPPWEAVLHPVANALFLGVVLDGVSRRARGGVVHWKGRPV